ncbi:hypothetical protein HDU86_001262 [Geranomyces michiganensis]|nr:hypothetical protein HDU86_001262 [Geranomyces michiganensis]
MSQFTIPRIRRCCTPLTRCLPRQSLAYASSSSSQFSSSARASAPKASSSASARRRAFTALPTDNCRFPEADAYYDLPLQRFGSDVEVLLSRPVRPDELEIDKDRGYLYLCESSYHELLTAAFGASSWELKPITPFITTSSGQIIYRAYCLLVNGKFVSETIGDWSIAACGGNVEQAKRKCDHAALVRCGKDLGIATELWDPRRVNLLRADSFSQVWVDGGPGSKKKKIWLRKGE